MEKIHNIVKLQFADMKRALYGMGNFQLAPWMQNLRTNQSNWVAKSDEDKKKHFKKFLKGVPHPMEETYGGRFYGWTTNPT